MQRFPQPLGECPPGLSPLAASCMYWYLAVPICCQCLFHAFAILGLCWEGEIHGEETQGRMAPSARAQVVGPAGVTENFSQCCSLHRAKSETVCSRQLTSVSTEKYQYFLHIDQNRVENFGSNNQVSRLISMCLKMFLLLFTDEGLERA